MSATVSKLARAVSELELNDRRDDEESKPQRPSHKHHESMAKLLTKYAAPVTTTSQATNSAFRMALATQPTNFTHVPKTVKPISSSSNLKSQIPSPKKPTTVPKSSQLDIGRYDGGLDLENDRRGSTVSGEAAQQLALDSSIGK